MSEMDVAAPPGRTYRYRPTDAKHDPLVLFGFGRGMSYAQFSYSLAPTTAQPLPSIAASAAAEPPVVQVGIVVSRSATDRFAGQPAAEVVLAFFEPQESQSRSSSNRLPMRRALFDFAKVQLPPGGNATVYFKISAKALVSAPQPVAFCNRRCVCPRCNHGKSPSRLRVRVEIMGWIIVRTDCDFPTILHFCHLIISTRTRTQARADRYDGALVSAPGQYRLVFTSGNDDDETTITMPLTVTGANPAVIEEFPPEH
jgi:hypothetical protein